MPTRGSVSGIMIHEKLSYELMSDLTLSEKGEETLVSSISHIRFFYGIAQPGNLAGTSDHWHHTFQFNLMQRGSICVSVEGCDYLIKEGDLVFINADVIHHLSPFGDEVSTCISLQLPPSSICSDQEFPLYRKYIDPVINNPSYSVIVFHGDSPWEKKLFDIFEDAVRVSMIRRESHELYVKSQILKLWDILITECFSHRLEKKKQEAAPEDVGVARLKRMLSYIQEHYKEKTTIQMIAAADVSTSECNRCFRKFLHTTPLEYLIRYRIIEASKNLSATDKAIAEISWETGFSELPYFYKTFKKYTGYTPKEYRIKYHKEIMDNMFV